MDRDTVILGAFCLFVVLVVLRGRLRGMRDGQEDTGNVTRYRSVLALLRWVVLGCLLIYMVSVVCKDADFWKELGTAEIFLRCFIFIFTIYIFISDTRSLLRRRNRGGTLKNKAGKSAD